MSPYAPTQTPDDIDIDALREKYRQERDKRIRPDGQQQYLEAKGAFADAYEADPHLPVQPRAPLTEEIDVAVLGAGFAGILTAYHLQRSGVTSFRNIDLAGDFGGCWYWNRYPGIQCDNDAYCYVPLLEETGYMPSKKFVDGWEIQEHCQRIGRQFGLYDKALFHTLVKSLRWDESLHRWRISTNRGDDIRARFVVLAGGPFNRPKLPGIPGIETFQGHMFHTARWDYAYTGGNHKQPVLDRLGDKRVGIVGTGATAVQAVPYLGRYAKELFVFQRTPSSVDARGNTPTDPEWVKTLQPGWQKARQANFHHGAMERFARHERDLIGDIWTEISRNLQAKLEAQGWPELTPAQYAELREVEDYRVMERLRRRVDAIVEDPATAAILKPWYRFLCKRPTSNDDFYPTFNRPNVRLIDVSDSRGVERITANGIVANGEEIALDCLIFASGFEITTDISRRWGIDVIEGREGVSLYDHWADGYRTLHGITTRGFPNLCMTGFTQVGLSANNSANFDLQGNHIAYLISTALARGATQMEPSQQGQDAWCRTIRETAVDNSQFERECTPSYYNNEGEAKRRSHLGEPYGPGFYAFDAVLQAWRAQGELAGLELR